MPLSNKLKIFNDPIYGFIPIPFPFVLDVIDHPFFQRLRRIKQLGLTHMVYPGALHTRFHHAIGAMHLMRKALDSLRHKGNEISQEEYEGAILAILLHDIGHGPFSHALEYAIAKNVNHEMISVLLMEELNKEFKGKLNTAIAIFKGTYPKPYLHELVSSQLDMDRLDYLSRDSFYSGVSEGVVGTERIISMLNIRNEKLVVESKGIYSIEKFLVARRIMYWQVYLHKTVVAAEHMLIQILKRAKEVAPSDPELFAPPSLNYFLNNEVDFNDFQNSSELLYRFADLDDSDILSSVKVWQNHSDKVLSDLSKRLIERRLLGVEIKKGSFSKKEIENHQSNLMELGFTKDQLSYYIFSKQLENKAYSPEMTNIQILQKDNTLIDIATASDNLNISALSHPVRKHFLCYPKELRSKKAE
ncbi:MAG: HD superfamily phosphohydrolase [Luteibaculaceae bacterium]|jgi:HD superfamily phosphohydrolase